MESQNKSPIARRVLDLLLTRLGPAVAVVSDHWADEPSVVAVCHPTDPTRLAYVLAGDLGHHVELVAPELPDEWSTCRTQVLTSLTDARLAVAVAEHLNGG
jgi:hypothetical protein